ncbi:hypothetical protein E2C01_085801 [Portunus trituberculatus]|uniref:Uncharacterized protein n=1 Tax=Portunus trituberculatus TaxID=210409 RepID=A0A5B7J1Z4_PORTR|nr:hypothetical protein [Portunus trituberculatus]
MFYVAVPSYERKKQHGDPSHCPNDYHSQQNMTDYVGAVMIHLALILAASITLILSIVGNNRLVQIPAYTVRLTPRRWLVLEASYVPAPAPAEGEHSHLPVMPMMKHALIQAHEAKGVIHLRRLLVTQPVFPITERAQSS